MRHMQHLTTLEDVSAQVHAMTERCTNQIIDVPDIVFDSLGVIRFAGQPHRLQTVAQRAIAARLNVPFQYLQRCPTEMQALNLNHWIRRERRDKLFVRFFDDDVRALFTTKYTPVDNHVVLQRLAGMGYRPDTLVQCHLDGEFMSLSIPDDNRVFTIDGDRMTPGICISNSEVGLASLSVAVFVLRLICTNGLIAKTELGVSYRHVSTRILNEFPQVMNQVSGEIGSQQHRFRLSAQSHVDDPLASIGLFNRQFHLETPETEAVEWAWPQEPGSTMFHIVNAYTKASQYGGLRAESRYRLQNVGGNILRMLKQ